MAVAGKPGAELLLGMFVGMLFAEVQVDDLPDRFCGSVSVNTVVRICWSIYLNYFLKSYCGTGMPDGAYDRYDYNTIKELFYTKVESDSSERRVVLVFAMHGAIPAGCGGN
ncbi:MAG: hypothetical protein ACLUEV_09815 [Alistipes sp.]